MSEEFNLDKNIITDTVGQYIPYEKKLYCLYFSKKEGYVKFKFLPYITIYIGSCQDLLFFAVVLSIHYNITYFYAECNSKTLKSFGPNNFLRRKN